MGLELKVYMDLQDWMLISGGLDADFCRLGLVCPSNYIVTLIPTLNKCHKQTNLQITLVTHQIISITL